MTPTNAVRTTGIRGERQDDADTSLTRTTPQKSVRRADRRDLAHRSGVPEALVRSIRLPSGQRDSLIGIAGRHAGEALERAF
jgi:hypothetical protein